MEEKRKFYHSLVFPVFFMILIWIIKIIEFSLDLSFVRLGILPLRPEGLPGILTGPLIHANLSHLFDNSVPLLLLSVAIFYFYRPVAYQVFFLTYIISSLLVWIGGRTAYHIGASGLVYGFASFLFFSGIIRKNTNLMAISLLVVFLYGSLVWGIFPFDFSISWESHLYGGLTGAVLAFIYREHGPPSGRKEWEEENEEEELPEDQSDVTDVTYYKIHQH